MLLDTHVLLWVLDGGEQLGQNARRLLEQSDGVEFSSISIAEIRIKELLGKLTVPADLLSRIQQSGIRPAPFTVAAADGLMVWRTLVRHDPFDRLLLTQAVAMRVPLLTADRILLALEGAPVIDARV